MTDLELVPEYTTQQEAPARLYEELLVLAAHWDEARAGDYMPNGYFQSQLDAQYLRAWLLRIRNKHIHAEVLESAIAFMAEPNQAGKEQDLRNLLRPYLPQEPRFQV